MSFGNITLTILMIDIYVLCGFDSQCVEPNFPGLATEQWSWIDQEMENIGINEFVVMGGMIIIIYLLFCRKHFSI